MSQARKVHHAHAPKAQKLHCAHAPATESAPPSTSQALHHANAPACPSHGNCTHAPSHGKYPRKHTSTSQARMARMHQHAQLTESAQRPRTSTPVLRKVHHARVLFGGGHFFLLLRNDCGESVFYIVLLVGSILVFGRPFLANFHMQRLRFSRNTYFLYTVFLGSRNGRILFRYDML